MEMRPLGSSGLWVSALGLGTVKIGRRRGLKYPGAQVGTAGLLSPGGSEPAPLPTDEQVLALLRCARDEELNLIDTAPAYGVAEQRLGEVLARADWLGGRDRWVLTTKVGEEFDDQDARSSFHFTPEHARMSVERSLRRLRTDHVDAVLVHSDGRDGWIIESSGVLEALADLARKGLTRCIGISIKSVEGGLLAVQRLSRFAPQVPGVVMVTYNPEQTGERPVIDAAARHGVGVLVKKGLSSGHAADARGSIRFVLSHPGVSSLVIGTTSASHLEANARASRAL